MRTERGRTGCVWTSSVEVVKLGAASYLTKPADADQIVAAFEGVQPAESGSVPTLARVEWEHIQRS